MSAGLLVEAIQDRDWFFVFVLVVSLIACALWCAHDTKTLQE